MKLSWNLGKKNKHDMDREINGIRLMIVIEDGQISDVCSNTPVKVCIAEHYPVDDEPFWTYSSKKTTAEMESIWKKTRK